ncbi:hypothetical protein MIMGU_mgv1a020296mg, partial [Erythranthe guttata]
FKIGGQTTIRIDTIQSSILGCRLPCPALEKGLSQSALAEMLDHSMPHSLVNSFHQGKLSKKVDWIPHSFAFRFMLSNLLVQ